jgi:hypothetical protein
VGATRSATEPAGDAGVLARPAQRYATPNEVDDHAWWLVPGDPATVLAYLDAHRAPKSVRYRDGIRHWSQRGRVRVRGVRLAAPILHVLSDRSLIVEVVRLPDGSTVATRQARLAGRPSGGWSRDTGGAQATPASSTTRVLDRARNRG